MSNPKRKKCPSRSLTRENRNRTTTVTECGAIDRLLNPVATAHGWFATTSTCPHQATTQPRPAQCAARSRRVGSPRRDQERALSKRPRSNRSAKQERTAALEGRSENSPSHHGSPGDGLLGADGLNEGLCPCGFISAGKARSCLPLLCEVVPEPRAKRDG